MKTIWSYFLLAAVLLLLSACESGAKFIVHNNCSYPAYVSVDSGSEVTIPAHGVVSIDVDTDTQSLFTGEVTNTVPVVMKGETFSLEDKDFNLWTDNTSITVKAGEDLHAYLNPNRASIKIVNNSPQKITEARIFKNDGFLVLPYTSLFDIMPGESKYMRVDYITSNEPFSYEVTITTEDGHPYFYGNSATIMLHKDEQYTIDFTIEPKINISLKEN
ncbi:hypothetical protein MASR2M64_03580 [Candidatus Cloacimonadota bacterium]|nr:hypothetical protein [Candidatus Cloacimonadota bacterium]MDD3235023.1 hypothetical protein [Candidatus Cloacimonadota bacterium]